MAFEHVCPVCHEAYPDALTRCEKCGEALVLRWIQCSICELVNEGYEEFCLRCGEPLATGQAIETKVMEPITVPEPEKPSIPPDTITKSKTSNEHLYQKKIAVDSKRDHEPSIQPRQPLPAQNATEQRRLPEDHLGKPPVILKPRRKDGHVSTYSIVPLPSPSYLHHNHPSRYQSNWSGELPIAPHPYTTAYYPPQEPQLANEPVRRELKAKVQSLILLKQQQESYTFRAPYYAPVLQRPPSAPKPAGTTFNDHQRPIIRAEHNDERKPLTLECQICVANIEHEHELLVCSCGNKYHRECMQLVGYCPNCGK